MVKLTINGKEIEVPEGTTVLRAAEQAGITIPTLCDHPDLTPYGGCRLCVVEVQGLARADGFLHLAGQSRHGGPHRKPGAR